MSSDKSTEMNELLMKYGKPVSFSDIMSNPYNGILPLKPSWGIMGTAHLDIPNAPFDLIQKHIGSILSEIEGLRFEWDNNFFTWKIEYGTRPIEIDVNGEIYRVIRSKKNAASHAACTANQWFPPHFDDDDFDQVDMIDEKKWSKNELRMYRNPTINGIFIHLNRMRGCHVSHWDIWNKIKTAINNDLLFL
jgi:hypothetical protein